VRKIDNASTAFAHWSAGFNIGIETTWIDPEKSAKHMAWTHAFSDSLERDSIRNCLVNFLAGEGTDPVRAAFGSNLERLVNLEIQYDPTNFFSLTKM
jgi:hypothetical protein